MVSRVKTALRISHNLLDSDIADTILSARAEMVRSGVSEKLANSTHPLIQTAIKAYCLAAYADDATTAEGYQKSWECQLDNIRKSSIEVPEEEGDGNA